MWLQIEEKIPSTELCEIRNAKFGTYGRAIWEKSECEFQENRARQGTQGSYEEKVPAHRSLMPMGR